MNGALKINQITAYFSAIGKEVSDNFVQVYADDTGTDPSFYGAFSFLNLAFFIVAFYPEEMIFAPVTPLGDFDGSQPPMTLDRKELTEFSVKKGLMQYKIHLATTDGKATLKCSKVILIAPWQKENLKKLVENNWYR